MPDSNESCHVTPEEVSLFPPTPSLSVSPTGGAVGDEVIADIIADVICEVVGAVSDLERDDGSRGGSDVVPKQQSAQRREQEPDPEFMLRFRFRFRFYDRVLVS